MSLFFFGGLTLHDIDHHVRRLERRAGWADCSRTDRVGMLRRNRDTGVVAGAGAGAGAAADAEAVPDGDDRHS